MKQNVKGWHGDTKGHRRVGRLGGLAPHKSRGLQTASPATKRRVCRLGGFASGKSRQKTKRSKK